MKNKRQKESAAIDRQRRKARRRLRRQDFAQSLCFLSPSLLGVGVFFIIPFGVEAVVDAEKQIIHFT